MDKIINLLREFCEPGCGYGDEDERRFYEGYSGRGMFGRKCPGIVTSGNVYMTIVNLCDFLRDDEYGTTCECVADVITNIKTDSLGMDTIIYFPNIEM